MQLFQLFYPGHFMIYGHLDCYTVVYPAISGLKTLCPQLKKNSSEKVADVRFELKTSNRYY